MHRASTLRNKQLDEQHTESMTVMQAQHAETMTALNAQHEESMTVLKELIVRTAPRS